MPCIVSDGTFSVYVYANDHAPPHCHVLWEGVRKAAVINLNTLGIMVGDRVPRTGMRLVRNHRAELLNAWNYWNP